LTAAVSGESVLRSRDGNGLPLPGDTGATSPAWAIDWLALSIYGIEADRVAELVSEAFHFGRSVGLSGWAALGGARFYGRRYEYLGATLLADPQAPGARDHVHVVLSGEGCAIGVDALLQLLVRLRMWSLRCEVARLDLAVDGVPFTPVDAYRAVQRCQIVSWVKRGRDGLVHHTWKSCNGDGEGDTLYLGGRASQRFMRIYDRRGPTRIELETKREYAQAVAGELVARCGDDAGLARFVVACLREFCDFGCAGRRGARCSGVEAAALVGGVRALCGPAREVDPRSARQPVGGPDAALGRSGGRPQPRHGGGLLRAGW
jgi:hypothetical protein